MGELISFSIWVTTACNMCCTYCYEGQDKSNVNMTEATADQVVEWIVYIMREKQIQQAVIRFHGGEPTLNMPVIKQIVKKLKKESELRFLYFITTNGYFISDENISYLAEHFSDISVSLDGMEKQHDRCRVNQYGQGTFQSVLSTAGKINTKFPKLWIRMTVNSKECSHLVENIHFLTVHGFKNIAVAIDLGDAGWTSSDIDILREQCLKIKKEFDGLTEYEIQIPFGNAVSKLCVCDGGLEKFDIDPLGRLYPCIYAVGEKELCLGSAFDGIKEEALERVRFICEQEIPNCKDCGGYESCVSVRCKFVNKKYLGDYFSAMPLICEIHRRELQ